jgi:hypothetical protein
MEAARTNMSKPAKIEIGTLHNEIGYIRSRAAIVVANSAGNKQIREEADAMERRAAAVERRLARLLLRGRYKYLTLPSPWKIHDIEKALDAIGATCEDRPENPSAGGGRSR